jgi:patatin-like phospholipase/acyl hydrolase
MVDGGIVANSADTIALMRALGRFRRSPEEIRMVSIGTAAERMGDVNRAARGYGAINWLWARRLFDVTTAAQESLSIQLATEVLGDHHIRINATPTPDQQRVIGLDITNEVATDTLLELAEGALPQLPLGVRHLLDAALRPPPAQL